MRYYILSRALMTVTNTPTTILPEKKQVLDTTQHWFEHVVLGLNLCPFAHRPARLQRIAFVVDESTDDNGVMDALVAEMEHLLITPIDEQETTLLIVPHLLSDFYDYQFFLEEAHRQLTSHGWQGTFQLASFHPQYCFAGAQAEDASNLTNRSPYPIIHVLREDSVSTAIANVDNPDDIPLTNIERMESLSESEKKQLFFYLED
jgi:hypothetical protein